VTCTELELFCFRRGRRRGRWWSTI